MITQSSDHDVRLAPHWEGDRNHVAHTCVLSPTGAVVLHEEDRDAQDDPHGQHDPHEGHVDRMLDCHESRVRGGALRSCGPPARRYPMTPTTSVAASDATTARRRRSSRR